MCCYAGCRCVLHTGVLHSGEFLPRDVSPLCFLIQGQLCTSENCCASFLSTRRQFSVMEAYENAKEEIEGENTVFQDIVEWWNSVLIFRRSKGSVTKYVSDGEGAIFDGHVSYLCAACLVVLVITCCRSPGRQDCDIERLQQLGLVDAVSFLDSAPVLKAYEEKHQLHAGSYEVDYEKMKNAEFVELMEIAKACGASGKIGKKFAYTTEDVQGLVAWYHGASCVLGDDLYAKFLFTSTAGGV